MLVVEKELHLLKKIINRLSHRERSLILKNIKLTEEGARANVVLNLFNLLLENDIDEKDLIKIHNSQNSPINILKAARSLSVIIENSILEFNIKKGSSIYDYRAEKIFKIRKRILYLDVLTYRGLRDVAILEYDKLYSELEDIECYDELIAILEKRKVYLSVYKNRSELKRVVKKIDWLRNINSCIKNATDVFHDSFPDSANQFENSNFNEQCKKSLDKIDGWLQQFTSATMIYYYKMIQYFQLDFRRLIVECEVKLNEIHSLLNANKHLNTNTRMNMATLNLAHVRCKLFDFQKAKDLIDDRNEKTVIGSMELYYCYLLLGISFYSFTKIDFEKYNSKIKFLLTDLTAPETLVSKINLLNASFYFVNYEYKIVIDTIEESTVYKYESEGWFNFSKLLVIICKIELECFDQADLLIESFRKQIEREGRVGEVNRIDIIKKILIQISRASYLFNSITLKKIQRNLSLLNFEDRLRWYPFESEIIPFHKWLQAKFDNRKYSHLHVMQDVKLENNRVHAIREIHIQ